jgi:hypothetical protein
MANEFQDALDNVKELSGQSTHDTFLKQSKRIMKGSATGLVVGLMYGWYTKKNIYVTAILGVIAGGAVNYFIFSE